MPQRIFVFTQPNRHGSLARCGAELCMTGWRAEEEVLLCPRRHPKCSLVCIQVTAVSPGLGEALFAETKKCGAGGVFLDGDGKIPGLDSLVSELCGLGLEIFSSVDCGRQVNLVMPDAGNHRFLSPRQQKTTLLPGGKNQKTELTKEELSLLLDRYAPRSGFSAELGCRYFTVKNREETVFAVYDTPETFRKRVTEADCETVFLEDRSVTDYLGGRL